MEQVVCETFTTRAPRTEKTPQFAREIVAAAEREWSNPEFTESTITLGTPVTASVLERLDDVARRNGVDYQVQGMHLIAFKR